jgi:predicted amidohydrolase
LEKAVNVNYFVREESMRIFRCLIVLLLAIASASCSPQQKLTKNSYRIAIVQFDTIPEKNEHNTKQIERLSREAAAKGAEIILFHESCVTDLVSDVDKYSELVPEGPACKRIEAVAKELGVYIGFGISEKTRDKFYYITHVFMGPKGFFYKYRKTWIWRSPEDEGYRNEWARYDVGDGPEIFNVAGLRATCFICADGDAPRCIERARLLKPDIVFYPSNHGGESYYPQYTPRAAEINAPTLIANRVGKSWHAECRGGCAVISRTGEVLAKTATGKEEILVYDLSIEKENQN